MEALRFAADSRRQDENQKEKADIGNILYYCGHGALHQFDRSARNLEEPRWRVHDRSVSEQRCIPSLLAASMDRSLVSYYKGNCPNRCAL